MAKHRETIIRRFRNTPIFVKYGMLVLGITLFTYKFLLPNVGVLHNPELANWCVVLGAASFIVIAISSSTASRVLKFYPIWLLGKVSYSFYLLHAVVLYSFTYLLYPKVSLWLIWTLTLVVSYLVAVASYYYIEQPSIRWGKRITSRAQSTAVTSADMVS